MPCLGHNIAIISELGFTEERTQYKLEAAAGFVNKV